MNNLLCFVLYVIVVWNEVYTNQIEMEVSTENLQKTSNTTIQIDTQIEHLPQGNSSGDLSPIFTKWTPWSRCEDCLQRRMKKCISPKCKHSKMYEKRPCSKKRCKRKIRKKIEDDDFHLVYIEGNKHKTKSSTRHHMWSKWSKWSKCTHNCRTSRVRTCRKFKKCKKRRQRQSAYCYHDNSKCEKYVINLLNLNSRRIGYQDVTKYEYNKQDTQETHQHAVRIRQCGLARKKSKMLKIIGGKEAQKYKWPWHVAVINRYREIFCAGTLIAPKWILTAGHCVRSYLRVRLNEHDLSAIDGRELEMTVQKMFLHPRFNHMTVDNDIALLRLPRAVKLPVVCLPTSQPETEEVCSIMGWGKLNSNDEYGSTVLQEAEIPVVNWNTCIRSYKKYLLTHNMFCAGWASGAADTCAGDSGGGLMCPPRNGTKSKGYTLQGITSFGDGCGRKNKYGIYTMVYNYLGWINYIIESYS